MLAIVHFIPQVKVLLWPYNKLSHLDLTLGLQRIFIAHKSQIRPLGSRSKPLCPELRLLEDYNVDLTTSRIECQPNAWKSKQQHGYTL